jgi:hypothetical protein
MPSAVVNALMPQPQNPAHPPQGFWGNAGNMAYDALGLGEAAKALRGQMTANEAQDFAFGAAAGLLPIGRAIKPVAKGIRAYHGSPHDFDRFDMSKIGTGEGAQAYGHGLYFAEAEPVARQYRDVLASRSETDTPEGVARFWANMYGREGGIKHLESVLKEREKWPKQFPEPVENTYAAINYLRSGGDLTPNGGKMYEVNINAHPDQFLDWDKPLSKQPGEVRSALSNLGVKHDPTEARAFDDALLAALQGDANAPLPKQPRDPMGSELYRKSGSVFESSSDPYRSAAFREAGIPGIKYLDQGSRTAGEGSRNYVVFDDKLIDIIKKYGLAALGLPPAMTAGNQIWNSQTQQ